MTHYQLKARLFRLILDNREAIKSLLKDDYGCIDRGSYGENMETLAYQRLTPLFPKKVQGEVDAIIGGLDWYAVSDKLLLYGTH